MAVAFGKLWGVSRSLGQILKCDVISPGRAWPLTTPSHCNHSVYLEPRPFNGWVGLPRHLLNYSTVCVCVGRWRGGVGVICWCKKQKEIAVHVYVFACLYNWLSVWTSASQWECTHSLYKRTVVFLNIHYAHVLCVCVCVCVVSSVEGYLGSSGNWFVSCQTQTPIKRTGRSNWLSLDPHWIIAAHMLSVQFNLLYFCILVLCPKLLFNQKKAFIFKIWIGFLLNWLLSSFTCFLVHCLFSL